MSGCEGQCGTDELVRSLAYGGTVQVVAATTTGLVEEAHRRHGTWPTATAALGRVLTAALLMGSSLKDDEKILIQICGNGPLGRVVGEATARGQVRGYVQNPHVDPELKAAGKMDVATAVGREGVVVVIKDLGLKEPYQGTAPLVSGEIAEDLTYYLAQSEQIPSAMALGVLVGPAEAGASQGGHDHAGHGVAAEASGSGWKVLAAGGLLVQALPSARQEVLAGLENRLARLPQVSSLVARGRTAQGLIDELLEAGKAGSYLVLDRYPVEFDCGCSRERVARALVSLGTEELARLDQEGQGAQLTCRFCNTRYFFGPQEIHDLLRQLEEPGQP